VLQGMKCGHLPRIRYRVAVFRCKLFDRLSRSATLAPIPCARATTKVSCAATPPPQRWLPTCYPGMQSKESKNCIPNGKSDDAWTLASTPKYETNASIIQQIVSTSCNTAHFERIAPVQYDFI
jgi:hypothetical protein